MCRSSYNNNAFDSYNAHDSLVGDVLRTLQKNKHTIWEEQEQQDLFVHARKRRRHNFCLEPEPHVPQEHQASPQEQEQPEAPQKRVRFGTVQVVRCGSNHCNISGNDVWYTNQDYAEFRTHFLREAQQFCRRSHFRSVLNRLLDRCGGPSRGDSSVDKEADLQCELQQAFSCSSFENICLVGLDCLVTPRVHQDKKLRRQLLQAIVRDCQARCPPTTTTATTTSLVIRTSCQAVSQVSVRYAQRVAQAAHDEVDTTCTNPNVSFSHCILPPPSLATTNHSNQHTCCMSKEISVST